MKKTLFMIGFAVFLENILFGGGGFSGFMPEDKPPAVIGALPDEETGLLYHLQVGAFGVPQNAENVFEQLAKGSLNPVYDRSSGLTRVALTGISAKDIPGYVKKLHELGFTDVFIREMTAGATESPSNGLTEIGYRILKVGETRNIADLGGDQGLESWTSSAPSTVAVNNRGDITGLRLGNGVIRINETEYISVVVIPEEDFYVLPSAQAALLPPESKTGGVEIRNLTEYRTEPTFRLAYRFNNKGEYKGVSGENGGIDVIGRGKDYQWVWTTFGQGGWHYDLNGVKHEMINGYQKDRENGVELSVKPEFVYDHGVPYLQLRHILRNVQDFALTGQRFGASADIMIHENDYAALRYKPYGAYMADSETEPSLELLFVSLSGQGIHPADTLWLGLWEGGGHLESIYEDRRIDVIGKDSAIAFSYKDITLEAGETKEFIVRFTLAVKEQ